MNLSAQTYVLRFRDGNDTILLFSLEITFDMIGVVFEFDRIINLVYSRVAISFYWIVWHLGLESVCVEGWFPCHLPVVIVYKPLGPVQTRPIGPGTRQYCLGSWSQLQPRFVHLHA